MSQVLFFRCATMRLELGELFGLAISWKAELMALEMRLGQQVSKETLNLSVELEEKTKLVCGF